MSKSKDTRKDNKKKPAKSLMEKRAANREKKALGAAALAAPGAGYWLDIFSSSSTTYWLVPLSGSAQRPRASSPQGALSLLSSQRARSALQL